MGIGRSLTSWGAIPILYRATLLPASGAVLAFLTALTMSLAYHHSRVSLGVFATVLALPLPYSVN
jgi:hypothetical protein